MLKLTECCKFTSIVLLKPFTYSRVSVFTGKDVTIAINANLFGMSKVTPVSIFTIAILISSAKSTLHFLRLIDVYCLKSKTELKTMVPFCKRIKVS